jgi:TonB-dependent SusC/RagA subfamily outer membrane receptor
MKEINMRKYNIFRVISITLIFLVIKVSAFAQNSTAEPDSLIQNKIDAFGILPLEINTSTAAVSNVGSDKLYRTTSSNLTNTLPGLLSGMTLIQGTGEVGNNNAQWLIRGIGSYGNNGFNAAKIFVDGFEVNSNYLAYLSPVEIESFSILKDAATLTAFGERGANGIIWIETKRGKVGPSTVSAQMRFGSQSAIKYK